jgi:hypothetical protein
MALLSSAFAFCYYVTSSATQLPSPYVYTHVADGPASTAEGYPVVNHSNKPAPMRAQLSACQVSSFRYLHDLMMYRM